MKGQVAYVVGVICGLQPQLTRARVELVIDLGSPRSSCCVNKGLCNSRRYLAATERAPEQADRVARQRRERLTGRGGLGPAGLPRNPAFSQAVSVEGPARTIYVGGQNAVDADGTVASQDPAAQTARALQNLELVLADAGARLEDVVSWSILVVAGQPLSQAFAGFQQVWGARGEPPAITVAFVAGLANPQFLVEVSAVAVVPQGA